MRWRDDGEVLWGKGLGLSVEGMFLGLVRGWFCVNGVRDGNGLGKVDYVQNFVQNLGRWGNCWGLGVENLVVGKERDKLGWIWGYKYKIRIEKGNMWVKSMGEFAVIKGFDMWNLGVKLG
jgi:hypothetical protein